MFCEIHGPSIYLFYYKFCFTFLKNILFTFLLNVIARLIFHTALLYGIAYSNGGR